MPISHKARSFNCRSRFFVGSSSNRYTIPFYESLEPLTRSFKSFSFIFICVCFFCDLFHHFCLKVRTRNWYANLTKFPNLTNKFFFRSWKGYSTWTWWRARATVEDLTKEEIEELEEQEDKYQKEKKKRKMKAKDDAIRERTRKRMKGLSTKSTE